MAEMGILGDGMQRGGTNLAESRDGKSAQFQEYDLAKKQLKDKLDELKDPAELNDPNFL